VRPFSKKGGDRPSAHVKGSARKPRKKQEKKGKDSGRTGRWERKRRPRGLPSASQNSLGSGKTSDEKFQGGKGVAERGPKKEKKESDKGRDPTFPGRPKKGTRTEICGVNC